MLTFSLLRHAKSSWDDPGLDDQDRPLSQRGESAAALMGAYFAELKLIPDLVLCSDAVRTRETLKRVLPHFGAAKPKIVFDPKLYLASEETMLEILQATKAPFRHVLMVGHNPGTHALAMELAASGPRRDIATLSIKFPTCGLAVFTFEGDDWSKITPAGGRLRLFQTPKRLA